MRNQADVKELGKVALKTVIEKNHAAFTALFQPNLQVFVPEPSIFNQVADQVYEVFPTSLDVDSAVFTFMKSEPVQGTHNIEMFSYEYKTKKNQTILIHVGVNSVDLTDNSLHIFYLQPVG